MVWWWLAVAVAAEDPGVQVVWQRDDARLHVVSPAGEHVAEDAPVDLDLQLGDRGLVVQAMGADLDGGLALGDVRGATLDGVLALSLCEDGGTRCRFAEVDLHGVVGDRRRGVVSLEVRPHHAQEVPVPAFPSRVDAGRAWEDVVARAQASGRPILVDFGAVWCPPCNLLAAEVLDVTPTPEAVAAFEVVVVDVDDPSSWALKDRFEVGGYPTLVAARADGRELGRMVGYPGADDTLAWLDAVVGRDGAASPDALAPREAAARAWEAVRAGQEDRAAALLAVAAAEPDNATMRVARLHLEPTEEDLRWLAERAPGRVGEWGYAARGLAADDPALAARVREAVERALPEVDPVEGADLLALVGELAPEGTAAGWYAAAAALLRTELTGDPRRDKGHLGWLAWLTEHAGRPDRAIGILEDAASAFPDEPTFHRSLARLHLRQGQPEAALAAAETALARSWGDNRLMVAMVKVDALLALGREAEARTWVTSLLAAEPAPDDGVDVRTRRYREGLRERVGDP